MTDEPNISRRSFFKRSLGKATELGTQIIEEKVAQKAKNWIRPPFAIAELDFILACNRCGDCTTACPYDVVFPLPATKGIDVAGTPAMDILNKGCHLCTDWPCVTACETDALNFSYGKLVDVEADSESEAESEETTAIDTTTSLVKSDDETGIIKTAKPLATMPLATECPSMAKAKINTKECMPYSGPECGACRGSCPIPNTLTWSNEKPSINQETCIGCGLCREACITSPKSVDIRTV